MVHFLSFASQSFIKSLYRIKKEANDSGFFDTVTCIASSQLPFSYRLKHWWILNRFTRGYGYWMWKSYITKQKLESIAEGDILVYLDAGCVINKEGKQRFEEYLNLVENSEFLNLSFQTVFPEKTYTKGDVFKFFNVQDMASITDSNQLVGGIFMLKKNQQTIDLIEDWYHVCHRHIHLINNSKSKYPNDILFIDHRHDQSVFSVLRKMKGTTTISDETWFTNWEEQKIFPFHARRLQSGI
jgi:hypothetical protein